MSWGKRRNDSLEQRRGYTWRGHVQFCRKVEVRKEHGLSRTDETGRLQQKDHIWCDAKYKKNGG